MVNPKQLPDIASDHQANNPLPLQWVGMEKIAIPLRLHAANTEHINISAKADLYVSVDKRDAKGIHMSRLHLNFNQLAGKALDKAEIDTLLDNMVKSQEGISQNAKINLAFDLILKKPSLLSNETGYQAYPVKLSAEKINDHYRYQLSLTIPYSSTCPCSASLSRQLYSDVINDTFPSSTIDKQALLEWLQSEAGSVATPHSQRSYAYIQIDFEETDWPDIVELVFQFENAVGTPVQTAVKRQDEQAFARLNAQNLMFCEDAARRIKHHLEQLDFVSNYWFKVEHQESLHAHNAVVIDQKNT